jgi:ubiquitin carboxyl-terminal hydrolase 34
MLVGVLVHSGSANSGHYYSYIKERKDFVAQERWLEFNDTNVTEFDKNKLAQECFGTQKMQ